MTVMTRDIYMNSSNTYTNILPGFISTDMWQAGSCPEILHPSVKCWESLRAWVWLQTVLIVRSALGHFTRDLRNRTRSEETEGSSPYMMGRRSCFDVFETVQDFRQECTETSHIIKLSFNLVKKRPQYKTLKQITSHLRSCTAYTTDSVWQSPVYSGNHNECVQDAAF